MPGLPSAIPPTSGSGNVLPAGNSAVSTPAQPIDQLALTNEVSWRDISFPCTNFKENGGQTLAVHMYPNLDGARVEPTGREPSKFSLRAVMTNNVYPSSNETWPQGQLFPQVFNNLLAYLYNDANLSAGQLVHPSLSKPVYCRVVNWNYEFTGGAPRDGVFLDIDFIETDELVPITISNATIQPVNPTSLDNPPLAPPNLNLGQFLQTVASAVAQITSYPANTIQQLNSQLAVINSSTQSIAASLITAIPQTIASAENVASYWKSSLVSGVLANAYNITVGPAFTTNNSFTTPGTTGLDGNTALNVDPQRLQAVYKAAFSINNTTSGHAGIFFQKVETFLNSLIYYYNALNNVQTASIKLQLELLLNQIQQVQQIFSSNPQQNQIKSYTTVTNISMISLVNYLNQNLDDFINLNPFVTKYYFIPSNTTISYYQSPINASI